jgi:hypothetical protein
MHLREPGENVVAAPRARRTHDCDALGEEPTSDEAENLRRGTVEPLRVVDDAQQRLPLGDLSQQRERCDSDEEWIGW